LNTKICLVFTVLFLFVIGSFAQTSSTTQIQVSDTSSTSEKFYSLIKSYTVGSNDVYETPYYAILGKTEHPRILVNGGMHGDEIASYMACDTIIRNINIIEGSLIIIPRINILACLQNRRFVNMDLNHAFPGDQGSDIYEFRLAYELMWLVDSIKPDIIINLHEALNKYDSEYKDDSEKAYGQIIITCIKPFEEMLLNTVYEMNMKIPIMDYKFNAHYYSFREYSSMDNFISKFGIKSYTVETYRGLKLEDRIKLQQIAVLQFMDAIGMKYEYPEIKFN
jgi:predicted deacylase